MIQEVPIFRYNERKSGKLEQEMVIHNQKKIRMPYIEIRVI